MINALLSPTETARLIAAGKTLLLAGEEKLLASLPPGNWIGGTIPYFMAGQGGCFCQDKIFVTEIPQATQTVARAYSPAELPTVYDQAANSDVSFVILPAGSAAHTEFALNAPRYPNFAGSPLLGWVAGVDLKELGRVSPKVFCGSPKVLTDAAAVLHVKLPAGDFAQINIINLFTQGQGDVLVFPKGGFSATTVLVNGKEQNFADYLTATKADTRLPLVANYCGAMVNVSFKNVNAANRLVEFYAPVVTETEYHLAAPLTDYVKEFEARLKTLPPDEIIFSCNCILNYLYSQLEGHRTGNVVGPITFGEIAYQLLNQTLVYLTVEKAG
jgi:hypothetical protein